MTRKNWSNLFLLVAILNLVLGVLPHNPLKIVNWVMLPCCITLGTWIRRRMI